MHAPRRFGRLPGCQSGSALVEFAIVAPFLLLLLIGIIDFGRYAYDGILAANAARAGVAYGAQNLQTAEDLSGIENAALADAGSLPGLTASPTPYCLVDGSEGSCATSGAVPYVKVVTSGTFTPLIKYPGLPSSIPITGTAIMRVESE